MNKTSVFTVSGQEGSLNLFSLAIPMLLESIITNLIGFVNAAVLSGYSDNAVAATGTAAIVFNLLGVLTMAASTGASVAICTHLGERRLDRARKTAYLALLLNSLPFLLLSLLLSFLSRPLMLLLNLSGEVLDFSITYFSIRVAFFFVTSVSSVLSAVLRCFGYVKPTVVSSFAVIGVNLLLNIWVVRFPQYSPVTGVAGIAVGCVISQFVGLGCNLYFTFRRNLRFQKPDSPEEGKQILFKILQIGVPSALSAGAYTFSQVVTSSFVALIGMAALSARVYYSNILCYAYLFSINFGNANAMLVGRLAGAGEFEHAKQLNRRLLRITCCINGAVSLLIILLRVPLLSIFTDDGVILREAVFIFLIDATAEQARAVSHVYEYALRGLGDMRFMMIVTMTSCWLFGVGATYFLSLPLGLGLVGCWIGTVLDEAVRAVASVYRWKKRSRLSGFGTDRKNTTDFPAEDLL